MSPHALLIGDVIGSRGVADRRALHSHLTAVLAEVNEHLDPVHGLEVTVGDEYQGVFATVGAAVAATLVVRLRMLPDHDVRHGVGWGERTVLDDRGVQDGPGWWAARAAIDEVRRAETTATLRNLRTSYRLAEDTPGADEASINAALVLRDEQVTAMSTRSLSVLRGLLEGRSQKELADELEVSASAVSQRIRSDGLAALLHAHDLLATT